VDRIIIGEVVTISFATGPTKQPQQSATTTTITTTGKIFLLWRQNLITKFHYQTINNHNVTTMHSKNVPSQPPRKVKVAN